MCTGGARQAECSVPRPKSLSSTTLPFPYYFMEPQGESRRMTPPPMGDDQWAQSIENRLRDLERPGAKAALQSIILGQSQGNPQYYQMNYTPTTVSTPAPTGVPLTMPGGSSPLEVRPNPSVREVEISFVLERASSVQLGIYDVEGRRVAGLLSGSLGPGSKSITWAGGAERGGRVRAGVYLVKLVVDSGPTVKRIVVMR
jgi:FlgD Ig-like domain